ncbi:adenylate/guanylate cyclase domain-containing protein [Thermodesulfobacteriota bacterium]
MPPQSEDSAYKIASPGGLYRPIYNMRIFGSLACIVIACLYIADFGEVRLWYIFLLVLALAYPHVAMRLTGRRKSHEKVELGTSLMDAFVLGSVVYVVGFSPIPALSFLTVALANGMALGSFPFSGLSVLSVLAGIGLPMLIYGSNYNPQDQVLMNLLSAVFLLLYFNIFAWVAYKRSIKLKASRSELIQQKLTVEIEKKKSDSLLWALLPVSVASIFENQGSVGEPCRYEELTLLVADVYKFHRILPAFEAGVILSELNHCFKAFDKIVLRHGLEPLRTVGDSYFAVGGGPVPNDTHAIDAVAAALEMSNFVVELKSLRAAADLPSLDFRFAVHTGPVIGGVVQAHKFSFDVWGDTLGETVLVERSGEPGRVMVSETTYSQIEGHFSGQATGSIQTKAGSHLTVYTLQPEPIT